MDPARRDPCFKTSRSGLTASSLVKSSWHLFKFAVFCTLADISKSDICDLSMWTFRDVGETFKDPKPRVVN